MTMPLPGIVIASIFHKFVIMTTLTDIEKKKELRRLVSSMKKAIPVNERKSRSEKVIERLKKMPKFMQAGSVMLYWSLPDEVFTHDLVLDCAASGKKVYLPVVDGDDLRIRRFTGMDTMREGESFSIPEPSVDSEEVSLGDIDLVVVPGVAFDMRGGRMGRGKGFYDRLFSGAQNSPYKVGICFDFQIMDNIPMEAHDALMDAVLSETRSNIRDCANRVCSVFGIRYPIVSGGMVWCSGWRLASAVSNAGGLGLIGAGSMKPDLLREHIEKCRYSTTFPYGVNVPLISPYSADLINVVIEERVPVVFTSAGNPKLWTEKLHNAGIKVAHVVSSSHFARKSQDAGVDAVVAEGFEAGGHNGREETSTMVLVPAVRDAVDIPVIAAGGIATGGAMAASFALGADGVQVGTRFALTSESSASEDFKMLCLSLSEGDTMLSLKKLSPTRLIKNALFRRIDEAESRGASKEELQEILGRGKTRSGIFEGDLEEGELEIGQVASLIEDLPSAAEVVRKMVDDYNSAVSLLRKI